MSACKRLLGGLLNCSLVLASAPSVALNAGVVHGTTCNDIATSVYRGIPFAQPPTGSLRFMPPQPYNTSFPNGALNASQFSATCIQVPDAFAWTEPSTSEDCLTLTVYVPPGNMSGLPVKVWVHGGDDTGGSASYPLYDLCHMATDSIAVAVQYRLGPLGFLALETAGIEGNMGIKDQLAALQWVQNHIASFGGDPKKVLLFGQSSGADDVYALSSLPQAKSLISSVICESGGGLDLPPSETMQNVGAGYAAALNCSRADLTCLQTASVEVLNSVYLSFSASSEGQGTIQDPNDSEWVTADFPNGTNIATPFLDGKLFTQQPLDIGPQVPIILGWNKHDASLFVVPPFFETGGPVTADNYTEFLTQYESQTSLVVARYPLSMFNSSGSTSTAVMEALTYIDTVSSETCFAYRGLRSATRSGVAAYAYRFDHTVSCPWLYVDGVAFPSAEAATLFAQPMHTAEIPLVLGNLLNQPWGNGTCNMTQNEYTLSANLKSAWTAMAATGNPSIPGLTWTQFDECSTKGLVIGNATTVQRLDFSECEFWDQIQHALGGVAVTWPNNQTCLSTGANASHGSNSSSVTGRADATHANLGFATVGILALLLWQM